MAPSAYIMVDGTIDNRMIPAVKDTALSSFNDFINFNDMKVSFLKTLATNFIHEHTFAAFSSLILRIIDLCNRSIRKV